MTRVENDVRIQPSVLDRLLDDASEVSLNQQTPHAHTLRQFKQAVTRDLEALINTRQETVDDLNPALAEVRRSLLTYGLPDFSTLSLQSLHDRNRIRQALEQTIAQFEPRLERVHVTLEPPQPHEQALRFRIEALLRLDPAPEPVCFDAKLLNTQKYVVQGHN